MGNGAGNTAGNAAEAVRGTIDPAPASSSSPSRAGVAIRVKVVPGASRSRIVGVLGDRLKVAVAAPPEDGKANAAVCGLLAEAMGVSARDVRVSAGMSQPRKTITVAGVTCEQAAERIAAAM